MDKCPECFATDQVTTVKVRDDRGSEWRDSTLLRCANDDCWRIREGEIADRLTWIKNVYGYKYFGDYELSPEQAAAVWEAYNLASRP